MALSNDEREIPASVRLLHKEVRETSRQGVEDEGVEKKVWATGSVRMFIVIMTVFAFQDSDPRTITSDYNPECF